MGYERKQVPCIPFECSRVRELGYGLHLIVRLFGAGGHQLMLGWLAAGGVFAPGASFVPLGPSLGPVGGLLGCGGELVLGWPTGVALSPGAASEPTAASIGSGDRLFRGGGGLVPRGDFSSLSSLPSSLSSPSPSSGSGGEDPTHEGGDGVVVVVIGGTISRSSLFQRTSSPYVPPRIMTPLAEG